MGTSEFNAGVDNPVLANLLKRELTCYRNWDKLHLACIQTYGNLPYIAINSNYY